MNARIGTLSLIAVSAGALTAALGSTALGADSAAPPSQVYVIQGVPGTQVDVSIDGESVGTAVAAKAIIGPLDLSQGKHSITFDAAAWNIDSTFSVSRSSMDVVVHWPADITEQPEVTVFDNDTGPVSRDEGRVTVAHTAVVPPADIRVNDKVLFSNIANGEFVTADVPADTYSVEVVPTGQAGDPLLGPVDLPIEAGVLTRVFAIGAPTDGSMDAVVQTIALGNSGSPAPGDIPAGEAGLAATEPPSPARGHELMPVLVLAGAAGLGTVIAVTRRRRARP